VLHLKDGIPSPRLPFGFGQPVEEVWPKTREVNAARVRQSATQGGSPRQERAQVDARPAQANNHSDN
jgi:hypothetical protein